PEQARGHLLPARQRLRLRPLRDGVRGGLVRRRHQPGRERDLVVPGHPFRMDGGGRPLAALRRPGPRVRVRAPRDGAQGPGESRGARTGSALRRYAASHLMLAALLCASLAARGAALVPARAEAAILFDGDAGISGIRQFLESAGTKSRALLPRELSRELAAMVGADLLSGSPGWGLDAR